MNTPAIIPEPKFIRKTGKECVIRNNTISIVFEGKYPDLTNTTALFRKDLLDEFQIRLTRSEGRGYSLRISLLEPRDSSLGEEGYTLTTGNKGARLSANSAQGVFYGLQTFLQLLVKKRTLRLVPQYRIKDYPAFPIRGIHLDLKTQMLRFDYVKNIFKQCSRYKINTVLLEYEDKFPYRKHRRLASTLAFTRRQIAELVRYATSLHIQIIPKVQGLAHVEYVLKHKPYAHLREHPDSPTDLCPSHPKYPSFLRETYLDVMDAHKGSEYFHAGCDESLLFGTCERCRKQVQKRGKDTFFAETLNKIHRLIQRHGKKTILWADRRFLYPKISPIFDKNIIVMPWQYHDYHHRRDFSFVDHLIRHGLRVIICPAVKIRLDTSIFPDYEERNANTVNFIRYAADRGKNVLGVIISAWVSGRIPFETGWFGFLCAAEYSWSPKGTPYKTFEKKFLANYLGLKTHSWIDVFYSLKGDRVWNDVLTIQKDNSSNPDVCRERIQLADKALAKLDAAEKAVTKHPYHFQYLKLSATATRHRQQRNLMLSTMGLRYYQIARSSKKLDEKIKDITCVVSDLADLNRDLDSLIRETRILNKAMLKPEEVKKDIYLRYEDENNVLAHNISQLRSAIKTARKSNIIPPLITLNLKTEVKDMEYRYRHKPKCVSSYDDLWNLNL